MIHSEQHLGPLGSTAEFHGSIITINSPAYIRH